MPGKVCLHDQPLNSPVEEEESCVCVPASQTRVTFPFRPFPGELRSYLGVDFDVSRPTAARISTTPACQPNIQRQMTVTGGVSVAVH